MHSVYCSVMFFFCLYFQDIYICIALEYNFYLCTSIIFLPGLCSRTPCISNIFKFQDLYVLCFVCTRRLPKFFFFLLILLDREKIKTYMLIFHLVAFLVTLLILLQIHHLRRCWQGCKALCGRALVPGFKVNICPHEAPTLWPLQLWLRRMPVSASSLLACVIDLYFQPFCLE